MRLNKAARFAVWCGAALLAMCASLGAGAPRTLVHKRAPEFVRSDLAGAKVDLRQYRGKVVLLNFWATWCAPCRVEMPRFAEWQRRYAADGLQVIAISMDDDAAPVRTFVQDRQFNFPVVMGDEKLGTLYGGVLGLPITFLIARDGKAAARFDGEADLRDLEEQIQKLLADR